MKVELLAPCGDLERLKTAIVYGADAVYLGGKSFSLRSRASNFTNEDIKAGVEFAHSYGKRVYVTVNMIPHNCDFEGLEEYLKILESIGVDGIICASCAIASLIQKKAPKLEVHISTQQTTLNSEAISYWENKKVNRLVLAREVTLENLKEIMKKTKTPIEVFIHGAMCANYSGRCTISNLLTNRDANRGGCAQSCRWNYHLLHNEENLDKELLFSFGSKDMCAVELLEEILKTGVASLKIEGRMKTAYYLANVVKTYRMLIDEFYETGHISEESLEKGKAILFRATNRETCAGFYPGFMERDGQVYNNAVTANQTFAANILSYEEGIAHIEVRNRFRMGDKLVIIRPFKEDVIFTVEDLKDEEGNIVELANKPMQKLQLRVPVEVDPFCFIKLG